MQILTDKLLRLEQNRSDKMTILDCRDELLNAKREMLQWNKTNKKTQVSIFQCLFFRSFIANRLCNLHQIIGGYYCEANLYSANTTRFKKK